MRDDTSRARDPYISNEELDEHEHVSHKPGMAGGTSLHTRTFVLIRLGSDRPQIQVHYAQELGKPSYPDRKCHESWQDGAGSLWRTANSETRRALCCSSLESRIFV